MGHGSFVVSDLTSDWLGGDRYELRLSHGNGTSDGTLPSCMDTYVDSSSPSDNYDEDEEMLIALDNFGRQTILYGCDLTSHLLPAGYAVQSANVSMELSLAASGSPVIGAFESRQHNWTESGATWATYDGTNAWGTSGARGWERGALLTSTTVDSSYSGGDRVNWNVTQAVQSAMRENRSVDFIFDMVTTPSTVSKYALLYGNGAASSDRAEMTIVYVPGSDSVPTSPFEQPCERFVGGATRPEPGRRHHAPELDLCRWIDDRWMGLATRHLSPVQHRRHALPHLLQRPRLRRDQPDLRTAARAQRRHHLVLACSAISATISSELVGDEPLPAAGHHDMGPWQQQGGR